MTKILLIGGTNGRIMTDIESGQQEVRLKKRRTGFQQRVGGVPSEEEYVRAELVDSNGCKHTVFVLRGEDPIQVLINHYQNGQ